MFVRRWNSRGRRAVATSAKGHVYVAESGLDGHDGADHGGGGGARVEKFTTSGKLLATLRSDLLCLPEAVAVRACPDDGDAEEVFVVDASDVAVLVFRVEKNAAQLDRRLRCDVLRSPAGIALHEDSIIITDAETHQVHVLSMQDGRLLNTYGSAGAGAGQFAAPSGVAVCSARGEIYVCDSGNDRVQVLRTNGDFVRSWGASGTGNGFFQRPTGIAVSESLGVIAVADHGNDRIQAFDAVMLGRLVWLIAGHISRPCAIAFDVDDDVLVADAHGAQWFAPPGDEEESSESDHSASVQDAADGDDDLQDDFDDDNMDDDAKPDDELDDSDDSDDAVVGRSDAHESPRRARRRSPTTSSGPIRVRTTRDRSNTRATRKPKMASPSSLASTYSDDDFEGDENAGQGRANANQASPPRKSAWSANKTTQPANTARPGHKVHLQYARDALDLKEEVLGLRRQVADLENHKSIVLEEKRAIERHLDETLDAGAADQSFAAVELQQARTRTHVLDSEGEVAACEDALLLEERLLELKIMRKDLERSLPEMRKQVEQEEKRCARLLSERKRVERALHAKRADAPSPSASCADLRQEIAAREHERVKAGKDCRQRVRVLTAEKEGVVAELSGASANLERLRNELSRVQLRDKLSRENSARAITRDQDLSALRETFGSLGGEERLIRLAFASVLAKGQHDLDCEQILHALRFCAQFVPGKSEAVRSLGLGDVEQYVSLVTQADASTDPLRLNFAGFRDAFYDLHKPRSSKK